MALAGPNSSALWKGRLQGKVARETHRIQKSTCALHKRLI